MSDNQNRKALLSGFWYTSSNILVKSLAFITTPIFTRLLTQEEYGAFSNYASWTSIFVILTTLNTESTLISAKFDYKSRLNQYVLSILSLSTFSTLIWMLVSSIFINTMSEILNLKPLYVELIFLNCVFAAAIHIFQINERYRYEYKKSVAVALSLAILTTILSILLVVGMGDRLTGRILGNVLPTVLIGIILYIIIIRKGRKVDFSAWKYALKICVPYIPHLLSLTLLHTIDRVMIMDICGKVDTAIYSVAFVVGTIITSFGSSINQAFSPWLGDKLNLFQLEDIRKVSKYYIAIFTVFVLGIILLAPEIILLFGGKQYSDSIYVLLPIALGCVLQFIYTLFVNVEQFKKKTVWMAIASVVAAGINYLLNYFLIPMYGYEAAAYTTLISYMFLLIFHVVIVYQLGYSKVYSCRYITHVILLITILSIGIQYLYSHSVVRYVVIIVYSVTISVVIFRYRKLILGLLKKSNC